MLDTGRKAAELSATSLCVHMRYCDPCKQIVELVGEPLACM